MGITAEQAYAASRKFTKDTIEGTGAVQGKPCQIQSITNITGGQRVTFLWVDNAGTSHTSTMDVMNGTDGTDGQDGTDGVSVTDVEISATDHLIVTLSDGNTIDAGIIPTLQGPEGKSAYEVAVDAGYVGTEEEWLASLKGEPGDAGDSAYEIAVEHGYVGTEEEWLESLKGEDGFSPTIEVKTSTTSTYILTITTEEGSFDTPNLKGTSVDLSHYKKILTCTNAEFEAMTALQRKEYDLVAITDDLPGQGNSNFIIAG